jgi:hypothetical protein
MVVEICLLQLLREFLIQYILVVGNFLFPPKHIVHSLSQFLPPNQFLFPWVEFLCALSVFVIVGANFLSFVWNDFTLLRDTTSLLGIYTL